MKNYSCSSCGIINCKRQDSEYPKFCPTKELTHDEIPHTVTCYVENYEEKKDSVHIQVLIVVDRENLKGMIIGKNGSLLKEVGIRARQDMEKFLGKKVFLETYVKTIKNWRDQEKIILDLGLNDEDE